VLVVAMSGGRRSRDPARRGLRRPDRPTP